ncbi:MAG: 50S ribosomal protein L6 [Thermodesulfovibrionales bacterium]|nr:50S ribosomal protein L6 [Thermodesulfovibrionales bacterium]
MSRIGKKPIEIPEGVDVSIDERTIKIKGPKGELSWSCPDKIKASVNDGKIVVERTGDSRADRALHGLTRSSISNMVIGVSQGYQKVLEIVGVGYKAQVMGNKLILTLGYSHPIEFQLPEGIKASVDSKQTTVTLTGIDKHQLGQVAENLRALRPPDSYKGKGIRYSGEHLKLKAGKTGKK